MPSAEASVFMATMDLTYLSALQKGFVLSIRSLEEEIQSTQMSGQEVKSSIAELFPPAVLFSEELISLPLCHRKLRDWLDLNGANMVQHSSRRVLMTLATNVYDEAEDREAAEEIARDLIVKMRSRRDGSSSQDVPAPLQASSSATASRELDSNTAHKVAMRFKDEKKKFSGAIGEYFNDFVSDYLQASRDYDLTPTQKLQYLHNMLTGDAKRFYYKRIEGYAAGFSQAVTMLEDEYNSAVRQDRCKNYLSSLRLSRFVEEGLEISAALEKTYKVITKLAPQVPQSHRGEAHKVEFLRKAVVGHEWATEPLSRIATHKLTFQNMYSELEAALHLAEEGQLARMGDRIGKNHSKSDDVAGVFYQSQGRYLNQHVGLRTRTPSPSWRNRRQSKSSNPLDLMGCFNCDDPNHTLSNCTKPINVAKAAQRRLEYYSKKQKKKPSAHQVLYELCSQLDDVNILFGTSEELSEHEEEEEVLQDAVNAEEADEAYNEIFFPRD